jgi:23S rRNA pseudouridine1911/1915/1917 synthase
MLLLDWLIQRYPTAKRQTLKRMVEEGRVTINGIVARKLKHELTQNASVTVDERAHAAPPPEKTNLEIIHEDHDILIVNKPAGLLTSTVPREPRPTLLADVRDYLAAHDPRARVGLIHRLDRDASGLLVFSKNNAAYESLKKQFFDHTVDRVYTAIVEGAPAEPKGRIRSHLVELPDGSVRTSKSPGKGQHALTEYLVLRQTPARSMLRVILHTGRKHQIRVHLSERGSPIVNDPVYGKTKKPNGRLMLAATHLAFKHPRTGKLVSFETPMPPELKKAMTASAPK